jgi:hypothetical protein
MGVITKVIMGTGDITEEEVIMEQDIMEEDITEKEGIMEEDIMGVIMDITDN